MSITNSASATRPPANDRAAFRRGEPSAVRCRTFATLPYALDKNGPAEGRGKRARNAVVELLDHCKTHDEPDSPLFTLLDGFTAPQVDHEKTDLFRRTSPIRGS